MKRSVCRLVVVLVLFTTLNLLAQAPVQPQDARVTLGQATMPLNGPWKFHVGDSPIDPRNGQFLWAEPDFNDSAWEDVDLTSKDDAVDPMTGISGYVPGWTAKGHPGYWGYAWYRMRVRLDVPPDQQLALAAPINIDDVYQFYANGSLAGSFGDFGKHPPTVYYAKPTMFPVPVTHATQVLAFRFWMGRADLNLASDVGGFHSPPVLGERGVVRLTNESTWLALIKGLSATALLGAVFLLLALLSFCLILFDRSDTVYLWIALLFLLEGLNSFLAVIADLSLWVSIPTAYLLGSTLFPLIYAAWVIVWWIWFGRGVFRRLPHLVAVLTALGILCAVLGSEVFPGVIPHSMAAPFIQASVVVSVALTVLLAGIVIRGIRRQGLEGWLVLPVALLRAFSLLLAIEPALRVRGVWFVFGVAFSWESVASLLITFVIGILLVRRLLRSLERKRQMAIDVKQAQEVQQVILSDPRVVFHGFEIESEYRPARDVGGDFFQIIPGTDDGSLLIVAGDVTGKGLEAGMLVALMVGAIRSTADWTRDPGAILKSLNQRLFGRGEARATCLALYIASDGKAVVANAGHLPPYLNGTPVDLEGSLPLGMVQAFDWTTLEFQLSEGDHLLLLSDGVPEATDPDGQLFGFDRVIELLRGRPTAAGIAEAAQAFGQEDDISVISVTRMATQPAMG